MKRFFKKHWPTVIIFAFVVLLFVTNYKPGTILSGWDNLHPEFDFGLNIKRSIFAVWQEYQGLGLLGGMAHASDLFRQIFLLILSVFLPIDLLRYVWVFLTLFIGTTGAYFLIEKTVLKTSSKLVSLLGALFYLFNLATAQMFYVPFEAFVGFFAFLPWVILSSTLYVKNPSRKRLIFLIVCLLLATPAWYLQTVFIVFMIALTMILFSYLLKNRSIKTLKKIGKLYAIIIIINSFWLFPVTYFTITNANVNLNSKINQMSTETIFLQNKEFGTLHDVALLKGFMFNGVDPNSQGTITYMLKPWRDYLSNPFVTLSGLVLFAFVLYGFVVSIRNKDEILRGFSWLFIFAFIALAVDTPPFSYINSIIRDHVPILNQIFRFPFTKFSTFTSLVFAMLFAVGAFGLIEKLDSRIRNHKLHFSKKRLHLFLPSLLILLLLFFTLPMLQGHLFYDKERTQIPKDYLSLFAFFKTQDPNTRIANFPQYTFWGWSFYNWPLTTPVQSKQIAQSYGGSGFLWYGIEQPILDRAFDVWSQTDENYYYEISQALYSKNQTQLENVLNKYQITWIMIDKNIFDSASDKALFTPELESLLGGMPDVKKEAVFGNIEVYKFSLRNQPKNYVFLENNLPLVNSYNWNNYDQAFVDYGNYITTSGQTLVGNSEYYPFRSLFSLKTQDEKEFNIKEEKATISLTAHLPKGITNQTLTFPSFAQTEKLISLQLTTQQSGNTLKLIAKILLPQVLVGKNELTDGIGPAFQIQLPPLRKEQYPLSISLNGSTFSPIQNNNKDIGVGFLLAGSSNTLTVSDSSGQRVSDITLPQNYISNIQNTPRSVALNNKLVYDLTVRFPKIDASYVSFHPKISEVNSVSNCDAFRKKETSSTLQGNSILITSLDATACSAYFANNLPHDQAYAVFINSKHVSGQALRFWVENIDQQYAPLDTYLPKTQTDNISSFILPPMEQFGSSYAFHFDNSSIGRDKTINQLNGFAAYPVFYNYLESIAIKPNVTNQSGSIDITNLKVDHPQESLYVLTGFPANLTNQTTLILSQSFNSGWSAYQVSSDNWFTRTFPFIFGKEIKTHVEVNNWENGWNLDQNSNIKPNSQIVIVYLPQYLEYFGFLALIATFFGIFFIGRFDKRKHI